MTGPLALLMVEDSQDDAELVVLELARAGFDVRFRRVDTEDAMRAALAAERWDLVMSDYSMPRFDAIAALRVLRGTGDDVPFIIVSGTITEEIAIAAMREGASDFFSKQRLARLPPVVERELREAAARRERRAADRAAEIARRAQEQAARDQAALLRSVLDSLGDALVGQVSIVPAGEEILEVPFALSVTDEHQQAVHVSLSFSRSWLGSGAGEAVAAQGGKTDGDTTPSPGHRPWSRGRAFGRGPTAPP